MTVTTLFQRVLRAAQDQGIEDAVTSDLINMGIRFGVSEDELSETYENDSDDSVTLDLPHGRVAH